MAIQLENHLQFYEACQRVVHDLKRDMVIKLSRDAQQTIVSKSSNQLPTQVVVRSNGFVVFTPPSVADPDGSKAIQVEAQTGAYAEAAERLANEALVAEIIKRG